MNIRGLLALRPRATFRIYCDRKKRGKFYQVVILRRRSQMPRACRYVTGGRRGWSRTLGFCHSLSHVRRVGGRWRPSRLAGFVVLVWGAIGSGYVSHELTHAAHFRLIHAGGRRRSFESMTLGDDRVSEPLADLQGWLVAQFWTEFYRRFPGTPIILSPH